jgi:starch synthase
MAKAQPSRKRSRASDPSSSAAPSSSTPRPSRARKQSSKREPKNAAADHAIAASDATPQEPQPPIIPAAPAEEQLESKPPAKPRARRSSAVTKATTASPRAAAPRKSSRKTAAAEAEEVSAANSASPESSVEEASAATPATDRFQDALRDAAAALKSFGPSATAAPDKTSAEPDAAAPAPEPKPVARTRAKRTSESKSGKKGTGVIEGEIVSSVRATTDDSTTGLRILMIASEAVPFAKTGGLADVAGALPIALGRLGHSVTLVLPRYRGVELSAGGNVATVAKLTITLGQELLTATIYETPLGPNARAWLVDAPPLYDRDGLYNDNSHDHPDNPRRFAFLVRAAFEAAIATGRAIDVVHAHDWQAGLAPVYLKTLYAHDPLLGGVPSVFTIHNIAFTGICDPSWMPALDLGWDLFRTDALEFWHNISFLKAGINFGTKISTVSPKYAQEILTPAFSFGFEGVLAGRGADLVGILNGIDADVWNPAADPHIPKPYTIDDLSGKREAKRALMRTYGLPWDDEAVAEPLIGMVSRMTDQKGLDLIASIARDLPTIGARFAILGTGESRYEEMWRALSNEFPDRIAANIGFDEPLSHLIVAGADLFLIPSRFEPSGLTQMYSMRYGTLPLVRATGGLDDTVENYDPYTGRGNGFKFWEPSGPALLNTLGWALRVYDHPEVWQRLQRAGMSLDFSWAHAAQDYVALYEQALTAAGRPIRVAVAPG